MRRAPDGTISCDGDGTISAGQESSNGKEPSESRARSSTWRRWLLLSFAILTLALWATMRAAGLGLSVAWISYPTPELKVFRLPGDYSVALFSERWLIINQTRRSVVSASVPPVLFEKCGLALILLDRLGGVPLGDGVKGWEGETWAFTKDGVESPCPGPRPRFTSLCQAGSESLRVRTRRGDARPPRQADGAHLFLAKAPGPDPSSRSNAQYLKIEVSRVVTHLVVVP